MVPKARLGQIGGPLMVWTKFPLFVLVLLAAVVVTVVPAAAESFADLYLGAAFTQRADVRETTPDLKGRAEFEFDTSVYFGGRLGHWFEAAPYLGLALDVSHFRPDVSEQTVTAHVGFLGVALSGPVEVDPVDLRVTAISFDLMLRWPLLTSKEFPAGQLQPYFTVGPTIFIARAKDTENFDPPNQSDTDTSLGVKVGAGLAWQFHKNIALFGEYRFTHFSPKFEFRDNGDKIIEKTDLNTHSLFAGISFRF